MKEQTLPKKRGKPKNSEKEIATTLPGEKWKRLEFCTKHYEISNFGRLKSYTSDKVHGHIIHGKNSTSYKTIDLLVDGKRRSFYVHKLVAEYFVPKEPGKDVVIHLDYDKMNNNSENLKWVDSKEQYRHVEKKNTKMQMYFRLRTHVKSKLTPKDVEHIRSLIAKGVKQREIAKMYCISEMQITRIKKNENWKVENMNIIESKSEFVKDNDVDEISIKKFDLENLTKEEINSIKVQDDIDSLRRQLSMTIREIEQELKVEKGDKNWRKNKFGVIKKYREFIDLIDNMRFNNYEKTERKMNIDKAFHEIAKSQLPKDIYQSIFKIATSRLQQLKNQKDTE